ncbi:MAG: hypothetical protein AB7P03_00950 [Kofleriaceae bacterium]
MAAVGALAIACNSPQDPDIPELPWLRGLSDVRLTTTPTSDVVDRMSPWSPADEDCAATRYPGLALAANVTHGPEDEMILASFTQGVAIVDANNRLIARAPGLPCGGSADEIVALAFGRAYLEPTIVVTITSGGHREHATWVTLYRLGFRDRLEPVFTGSIEERADDAVQRGSVTLLPDGLIYRRPGGQRTYWRFDPVAGAYVYRSRLARDDSDEQPHVPPPSAW